jgi:hypothetical protein
MRIIIAMLWLTSSAIAEPGRGSAAGGEARTPTLAAPGSPGNAREPSQPYTPADRGGFSGIVIVPPATTDARPYPRGMVIEPPDVGDSMANELVKPWTWSSRSLWQRFGDGLRALWDQAQPREL